ncbi:MAG: DUF4184 family protein [Candidatus Hodarchaeota archaeon]
MPSSIFSHQAPALLIKMKYPRKIDGTALCISTFIPDLGFLLDPFISFPSRNISHSFLGILLWTVPLTILFTILFSKYCGPAISEYARKDGFLPNQFKYFGLDKWNKLKFKSFNKRFYFVAFYSAIIGGLTHLLLDLPSHENIELFFPWLLLKSPDFLLIPLIDYGVISIGQDQLHAVFTIYQLIWILETIVFWILSLYLLRYMKKNDLIDKWDESKIYSSIKVQ